MTVLVASGCSLREVTLWFQVRGATVSESQAEEIAGQVNARRPAGGCDQNYVGGCVPDNEAHAHCKGTPSGKGPAIQGPLLVVGWDSFSLDPDGNKVACDARSPIGSLDVTYQRGVGIVAAGWAVDPDDPAKAIEIHIYDNNAARSDVANVERPDLGSLGYGTAHGFNSSWSAEPGLHEICVFGINSNGDSPNTLLRCETMAVEPTMLVDWGTHETVGLLERAEFTKVDGRWKLHLTGFTYDVDTGGLPAGLHFGPANYPWGSYIMGTPDPLTQRIPRPDVLEIDPDAPTNSGFDLIADTNYSYPGAFPEAICLVEYGTQPNHEDISCRAPVIRT